MATRAFGAGKAERAVYAVVLAALLGGCASVPEALRPIPEAQPGIPQVQGHPDHAVGQIVVWGGVLTQVINEADGTRLEIVRRALDRSGRPVASDSSDGRFRAFFPGLLDPMVHAPEREVTVRGVVTGVTRDRIGEFPYLFPEVAVESVHLWPVPDPQPAFVVRDPFWDPWSPWYRSPWHPWHPGWR
jgi:outer membrane lipoprotein